MREYKSHPKKLHRASIHTAITTIKIIITTSSAFISKRMSNKNGERKIAAMFNQSINIPIIITSKRLLTKI